MVSDHCCYSLSLFPAVLQADVDLFAGLFDLFFGPSFILRAESLRAERLQSFDPASDG